MKENAVVCMHENCGETFQLIEEFVIHHNNYHEGQKFTYFKEFSYFYMRIGAGHYEHNLLKSLFEILWPIGLEKLCEIMGFSSPNSKEYAKKCKSHHLSWELLLVYYTAFLKELTVPFVKQCIYSSIQPTANNFMLQYIQSVKENPTIKLIFDMLSHLVQSVINFRLAIRKNDARLLHSSKFMSKELLHGRNHPIYQKIELHDTLQYHMMPTEVQKEVDSFISITRGGSDSGQDFDYALEEENRNINNFLPKGVVPSDALKLTVSRNLSLLKDLRMSLQSTLNISSSENNKKVNIEEAIYYFRLEIRRSQMLNPDENAPQHIWNNANLDEDIFDFVQKASIRRTANIRKQLLNATDENEEIIKTPVFLTINERQHFSAIENKTIKEICKEIHTTIDNLTDNDLKEYFIKEFKKIKNRKKNDILTFYNQITDLEELNLEQQQIDDNNN